MMSASADQYLLIVHRKRPPWAPTLRNGVAPCGEQRRITPLLSWSPLSQGIAGDLL